MFKWEIWLNNSEIINEISKWDDLKIFSPNFEIMSKFWDKLSIQAENLR